MPEGRKFQNFLIFSSLAASDLALASFNWIDSLAWTVFSL